MAADDLSEHVSALMDGEIDREQFDRVCRGLRSEEGLRTWAVYHLIGDALRGSPDLAPGFDARLSARLAAEPTVLAPQPQPKPTVPVRTAWALAASAAAVAVVGWVALPAFQPAGSQQTAAFQAPVSQVTQVRRAADVGDYVLVHQEYSPATVIQGVQPYIRAVSTEDAPGR